MYLLQRCILFLNHIDLFPSSSIVPSPHFSFSEFCSSLCEDNQEDVPSLIIPWVVLGCSTLFSFCLGVSLVWKSIRNFWQLLFLETHQPPAVTKSGLYFASILECLMNLKTKLKQKSKLQLSFAWPVHSPFWFW